MRHGGSALGQDAPEKVVRGRARSEFEYLGERFRTTFLSTDQRERSAVAADDDGYFHLADPVIAIDDGRFEPEAKSS